MRLANAATVSEHSQLANAASAPLKCEPATHFVLVLRTQASCKECASLRQDERSTINELLTVHYIIISNVYWSIKISPALSFCRGAMMENT